MRVTEEDGQPREGDRPSEDDQKQREERLKAFALLVASRRDEAVQARAAYGIEEIWRSCEESYAGIDDLNRHLFTGARWMKPTTMDGPVTQARTGADDTRATGFVRLTSKYVDAAAAKASEISIPIDGKMISFKATPLPEAISLKDSTEPYVPPGAPGPVMRQAGPNEMPPPDPMADPTAGPQPPAEVPVTKGDLAKHQIKKAEDAARKAETRIHDWLVECKHPATMRKIQKDMARLGCGVLKGPVPDIRESAAALKTEGSVSVEIRRKLVPVTKRIPPWNLFPDPACGEDIHAGDYILECDHLSPGKLEALKRTGFYINSAIDQVLREGPDKAYLDPNSAKQQTETAKRRQFTVWYYYGRISFDELELMNLKEAEAIRGEKGAKREEDEEDEEHEDDDQPPVESVHAIVTLVNDTPIRVAVNPLESGRFPYRVGCWRPREGYWAGIGVAEQLSFPQRLINAAVRAGMANAAKSAGSLIFLNDMLLRPMDDRWSLTPDKLFGVNAEMTVEDIRKAVAVFQIPNVTPAIMQWVELALRLAEESTNIPLITQGQSGKDTPDTFGGQQLQDNNAMQLLRDVGYGIAEDISNPLGCDLYEWLLLDPDVPNDEKGDAQIDANAAMAMVEKALQDQAVLMMFPLVQDPECGFDKRKYAKQWQRIKRLNPDDMMMTDEAFEQRMKQPPPPPPQIAVAQINAKSRETIEGTRAQLLAKKIEVDTDRDTAHVVSQERRDAAQHVQRMTELDQRWQLALLEYAKAQKLSLQDAKVELATLTMELRMQKELAGADGKGPQVATPKIEPEGRAPSGEAFQK
jgi:hypothetical protein